MATLVLTAVGGAIGGPVGAAIGSILGQAADRSLLFAPKGRQGPRLTELAVQTSSYGTAIPMLFGTIRVAGTVIWSTDLIETRGGGRAGKGQPSVTSYSYSASFAVALSARPIIDVRRIWADGKLLRGAAGDFKTNTGFRLHRGTEDQAVDPLIASAVGIDRASAHRGIAYAVFEGLQLADFGNRIPSLTFEVVADDAPVPIASIASALAAEVSGVAPSTLDGFAAGEGSVAASLSLLGEAAGVGFVQQGGGVRIGPPAGTSIAIADRGAAGMGEARTRRERRIAAPDAVPREVLLRHHDPARDYQAGIQRARRPGAGMSSRQIDMPAVLSAQQARGMAEAMLTRAEAERTRRVVRTDLSALSITPGSLVSIVGETGMWRVVEARCESMLTSLTLVPVASPSAAAMPASSGVVSAAPDEAIGMTIVQAFEIPASGDELLSAPVLTIAATGTGAGWRRAAILYSLDDGASWISAGSSAASATIGTTMTTLSAGPSAVFDAVGTVDVQLARPDMTLNDANDDRLLAGENLTLLGEELIQFGRAEPLGNGRWRLRRLLRGRRGTAIAQRDAGARFVLVDPPCSLPLALPMSAMGTSIRVMASGVGDDEPVVIVVPITGASIRPPAPVHLCMEAEEGGHRLRWTRRSRLGWRWIDGVDAPLGEESERYRVTLDGTAGRREIETTQPWLALPAGALSGIDRFAVRQVGTWCESIAAEVAVAAGGSQGEDG